MQPLSELGYDTQRVIRGKIIYIEQGFASYIMQCDLVLLLWVGLTGFHIRNGRKPEQHQNHKPDHHEREGSLQPDPTNHHQETKLAQKDASPTSNKHSQARIAGLTGSPFDRFDKLIQDFHKSQCYFSGTLQIASLCYGIFTSDMLITSMLIPLATNGVLPVVFPFILLVHEGKAPLDSAMLTAACCILAAVVYWTLYPHIIPVVHGIKDGHRKNLAYQQFMYRLSALDECGGYSAMAACPSNSATLSEDEIETAADKLVYLTPIIWTFSIICFLAVLIAWPKSWLRPAHVKEETPGHNNVSYEITATERKPWSKTSIFY